MLLILSPIISKVASRGWAASFDTTLMDVAPATSKPTSEPTTILVTKAEMKISFMTTVRLLKRKLTSCDDIIKIFSKALDLN